MGKFPIPLSKFLLRKRGAVNARFHFSQGIKRQNEIASLSLAMTIRLAVIVSPPKVSVAILLWAAKKFVIARLSARKAVAISKEIASSLRSSQ